MVLSVERLTLWTRQPLNPEHAICCNYSICTLSTNCAYLLQIRFMPSQLAYVQTVQQLGVNTIMPPTLKRR